MATPPGWEELLDPGETILWQGRPVPAFDWSELFQRPRLKGLTAALFGLIWTGIAFSITRQAPGQGVMHWLFPLFGLVMVAKGLDTLLGGTLRGYLRQRGSFYTLTDRNAFVATTRFGKRQLTRLPLGPGLRPALEEGDPGSVWLAAPEPQAGGWRAKGAGGSYFGLSAAPNRTGFESIPEARRVYRLILDAQTAAARDLPPVPS